MTLPVAAGTAPQITLRRALHSDLSRIVELEHASFSSPWSEQSLSEGIGDRDAIFLTAESSGRVVGYAGMWLCLDEAHVVTIAVDPQWRGRGLGLALMLSELRRAEQAQASFVVLEYRVSNRAAEGLYHKLGFRPNRVRRRYYQDTGEDAVEAILTGLQSPACRYALSALRADWETRYGARLLERD